MSFFHCQQVHQRSVHRRIPPSSHMSQLTVPSKDNREEPVINPPGQRPPEEGHLACHRQGGPDPGGPPETGTHCRKRWEDIRRCSKKTAEAQLGMASQRGRGARRTMTPLMFRILAVAYPELDGHLRTSQQTQGASSGGGTVAPEHEGAASHMAMEGHNTDSECTSGTEGEGSFTSATGSPTSDTDSFADGSSPVVAAPSVRPTSTGTAATSPTSTALPAAPQRSPRARSPRKVGITFAPGTSGPAPVTPAALSEEAIDLLRSLTFEQSTIINAIQGVERELQHGNAFLEGIHSGQASRRSASAKKPPIPVVPVQGLWSAPATRAGSRTRSQGTDSPPPVKALKLESGRRDRVKIPGGTTSDMGSKGIGESAVTPTKVGKVQRKSAQPVVSVTAEKYAIISGGPDTTASTVVTGPETTSRVTAQEGPSIVTGPETTARVTAQEGPSIVTGPETTARVTAQEGPSIVTGQETTATAGVTAQEGPSIVTGPETTARVTAQEGPSIVTGQETTATATAGITAQEGPSIVTGPETTARVTAQEGPSIVTGPETTARVTAQEGPSIVTGPETTARVTAQEGPSIVTGQETTATAGVTAQEGPSIVTGPETTARITAQEGPSIVTGQETTATAGVTAQEGPSIVTGPETTAGVTVQGNDGTSCHPPMLIVENVMPPTNVHWREHHATHQCPV
ncbi:hypothetical protein NDU88_007208 [Pleurodeles waltl]|uniref:Uncharacterized protein n=1 Tax=Pleurodeles waltl TaxID=8319 RepID=A0AAV7LTY5_PLEWA|nr:hypothetical protein NDU88_007208 [Pleurodeles waltl]